MKQKATVVKTDGKKAVVSVYRDTMCDGCHKNCDGGCSMYKIFGADKRFEAVALNKIGAAVGDTVYVETPDRNVLLGAFSVFMLPLVLAFGAFALLNNFYSHTVCIAVSGAVFAVYYIVLALSESLRRKKAPAFVITQKI